jgi:branched-chain amino acid transport system ATP-binding protein
VLSIENMVAGYGKAQVIHGIDLEVSPGEIVALVGPNGAGKTTTIRCVTGEIRPWGGSVRYGGADIAAMPAHRVVCAGISCAQEGRSIFGNLTVHENLAMGGYVIRGRAKLKERMEWVFDLFPRLKERTGQRAESLSDGEQQMLAIGTAIMNEPDLLLLDEPSLGLAPVVVDQIYQKIAQICREGSSILLVEQDIGLALETAGRAYVMESGLIRISGPSSELAKDPYVVDTYLGAR